MQIQGHYTQNWQLNSSKNLTAAVKALIAANITAIVVRLLYNILAGDRIGWPLERILGLNPDLVLGKLWLYQYVTYSVVYVNLNGVLGMAAMCVLLWWCGSELETAWSTRRFVFFYAVSGVVAGIAGSFYLRAVPEIGSSACAMAMLGAYGTMAGNSTVIGPLKVKHALIIIIAVMIFTSLDTIANRLLIIHNMTGFVLGITLPPVFRFADRWDRSRATVRLAREENEFAGVSVRVDELLDKISRSGIGSLTGEEKKFLQKASKQYKNKI
ncbi:MAG: rhomboid family intramembrane serine protease [Planctomycetes bacterium]|nr:rhomboid family intramembrane serine protease [Planctomycetota bacterium]